MFTSDSDEDVIDKVLLGNVKTPKILNLDLILPSVTDNLLLGSMRSQVFKENRLKKTACCLSVHCTIPVIRISFTVIHVLQDRDFN